MFFRQGFQHFLIADPPAYLLPAPPVESRFVAVDSGHFILSCPRADSRKDLAALRLMSRVGALSRRGTVDGELRAHHQMGHPANSLGGWCLGFERVTSWDSINTSLAFQRMFSIAKAQRAVLGCLRGQELQYTLHSQILLKSWGRRETVSQSR